MRLSISNSEHTPMTHTESSIIELREIAPSLLQEGYSRETAADRPGVAQPVPQRPIPNQPWNRILIGALTLFVLLVGSWEMYWRAFGAAPGIRNSEGLWAIQRRRIDNGEGDATVLLG